MRSQGRASLSRRLALLGVVLLIVGCSATPPPTQTPAADGALGELMAEPFGDTTIDAAVEVLAQSGIPTYQSPESNAPLVPVTEPAVPLRYLLDQVRAMALEANADGGIEGAELDALVDSEPDLAPPSFILAGYVAAVDTAGALAARRLMGVEDWGVDDWRQAPTVVFPQLVLALFAADVTRERMSDASAAQPWLRAYAAVGVPLADLPAAPAEPVPVAQGAGPCSAVSNFISGALHAVFNALRLGEPASGVGRVLVTIWNFVVSVLETIVSAIVKQFEQRVLDAIGRVAAIVGTVSAIVSAVRPWTVSIRPQHPVREKGIAGIRPAEEGQLTARVDLGGLDEWPAWAEDCARQAGRPLPNLKPEGAPIEWQTLIQNPPALVQEGIRRETLDATGAAQLDFTTLIDQVDDPYVTYPGAIFARVSIERPGLRDLADMAEKELWSELPSIVVGPLQSFLGPSIEKIKNSLARLLSVGASGPAVVLFHVQQPSPPPSATPTHTPTPTETRPPTPRPERRPCSSGCAMSNGDPHIVTIDGDTYDFMAAGEFVALRNGDGSFELQARQQPYTGSETVSINTALAMRVGSSRVGIYADVASDALNVTVDGAPVDATQTVDVGGGSIRDTGLGVEVTFPDGTLLFAVGEFRYGISVTVDPSDDLRQAAVGVMGPVPAGMGVPALPDGTALPSVFTREEYNAALYGPFEDAWRVTAGSSLFDYEAAASTDTYTLPDFPVEEDILTIDDLTPEQRAAAQAACAAIGIEFLRDQCIFDVAVTGDNGYGELYDLSANVVETGSLAPSGERVRVVNVYSNDTGPSAIDVYAWSDEGAALVATVPYGEASAWFDPGTVTEFERLQTNLSFQRQGEPVNDFQLNVSDLARDAAPGTEKTIVLSSDNPEAFALGGGRALSMSELYEESPQGFPLMDAPPDGALLFLNVSGLVYTHPGVTFFTSAGDGCLTQPDIPTLAQLSGVTGESGGRLYEGPLGVEPGTGLGLTLHAGDQQTDPFTVACDTPPIHGPVPFDIGAGGRSHLLVYATPGDPTLRSLILPFGE